MVILAFVLVNTYGKSLLDQKLISNSKELLADESDFIISEYLSMFNDSTKSSSVLKMQLHSINRFLGIRTWIVNDIGRIIIDSSDKLNAEGKNVADYYPVLLDAGYSNNVYISGVFPEPVLAFTRPISYDYDVSGYIVLFSSYKNIEASAATYLDIVHLCFLIFLSVLFFLLYLYLISAIL